MKSALLYIFAVWSSALTLLVSSAFVFPWDVLHISVPSVLLLAMLSRDIHFALRFSLVSGAIHALVFPFSGIPSLIALLVLAVTIGPLYRLAYSIPTAGSALITALVGTSFYWITYSLVNIPMYVAIGFPGFSTFFARIGVHFVFTFICVWSVSQLYRVIFLRQERAFV